MKDLGNLMNMSILVKPEVSALMAALEMVKNKETKEPFEGHLNMGDKVANMSIDNGLICRPLGPAIVLCPQFIINKIQIDEMFDILHKTLRKAFN